MVCLITIFCLASCDFTDDGHFSTEDATDTRFDTEHSTDSSSSLDSSTDSSSSLDSSTDSSSTQPIYVTRSYINNRGELTIELSNGQTLSCNSLISCEHRYGESELFSFSCTEKIMVSKCTICDNIKISSEKGDYHNYNATFVAPSCEEQGYTLYSCFNCGKSYKDNYTNLTIGHIWYDILDVVSTCKERTVLKYCDVCRQTKVIDALPVVEHNFVDNVCIVCGEKKASDGLEFELSYKKDCYIVTGIGTCEDESLVIPAIYNELPVKYIDNFAFSFCDFKAVTIPFGIVKIGECAFSGCNQLTSVTVSKSVEIIGESAFSMCTRLENVELSPGLISIQSDAFKNCYSLKKITIPRSVKSIYPRAFNYCYNLSEFVVDERNAYYTSIDGNLYTKNGETFVQYAYGKSDTYFLMPNCVKVIGPNAFSGCKDLTRIDLQNGITSIEMQAFMDCKSLESFYLPDTLTNISNEVFFSCNFKEITIPNNVKSIPSGAFRYCSLENVTIGAGLESLSSSAFLGCQNLKEINVVSENQALMSIDGNVYTKDGKTLVMYAPGKNENHFDIPNNVEIIGEGAFYDCSYIRSITISNNVKTICSYSFYYCYILESVIVGREVTSIESSAFVGCESLTIYCEAESQSSDWAENWNSSDQPVYWYSECEPSADGSYWHYGENSEIVIWE